MNASKTLSLPATKASTAAAAPTVAKAVAPVATATPTVAATVPATVSKPAVPVVAADPKKIDLNKPSIIAAITKGKALIKEGKAKAEAAMLIFEALKAEEKDVVIAAFVQGATLTDKGAVTYFYNCKRKAKKLAAKPA
jgi:hypothetical protein